LKSNRSSLFAAAAVVVASAWGNEVRPQMARFAVRSELVVLSATALDQNRRPVTDLRSDEFRITEDGRPQKLEHFSQGLQSRLRVLLLVDASGSMNGALKSASPRMVAVQVLSSLAPEDEAALAGFDHKYWGIVAFTKDRKKVEDGFAELEPFGSTALHDALAKAASDLASHGEGGGRC
jgi:VWFA-related protein